MMPIRFYESGLVTPRKVYRICRSALEVAAGQGSLTAYFDAAPLNQRPQNRPAIGTAYGPPRWSNP